MIIKGTTTSGRITLSSREFQVPKSDADSNLFALTNGDINIAGALPVDSNLFALGRGRIEIKGANPIESNVFALEDGNDVI